MGYPHNYRKEKSKDNKNIAYNRTFTWHDMEKMHARINDTDAIGEPLEMDSSESFRMHEQSTNKPCRLSTIGNWLQCQQVIDGVGGGNGGICGKWRRAPLFEVQTDDWECFCSILWDPTHADCAVPQELETGQVSKQLKYIEMLRPRLASKRRKLDEVKSRSDVQNLTEDTEHKP
uniref:CW-type domain-containing protein n=1 Tax=Cucumis sativus TaxID=3659 RepID=A0A0A0LWX9_CUCSA